MIVYAPIIGCRYVLFFLRKRYLKIHGFKCPSSYCVEGTLNSLQWYVENALYVRLNKYPMLKLGPQEKIFKVSEANDFFELECFGIKKRVSLFVQLTIVKMKPKDFDGVVLTDHRQKINAPLVPIWPERLISPQYSSVGIKPFSFRAKVFGLMINSLDDKELSRKLNDVGETKTLSEVNKLMEQS
ncbi:MAG: hypothetical protein ACX93O_12155 [Flagellimonas sp.]